MKCKTCNKELTPTNEGWIHPINNECPEDDGIRILNNKRKTYNAIYGIPKDTFQTIVSKHDKLKKVNALLYTKEQQLIKEKQALTMAFATTMEELRTWEQKPIKKLLQQMKKKYLK